jgi:hypothetical protein
MLLLVPCKIQLVVKPLVKKSSEKSPNKLVGKGTGTVL